MENSDRTLVLRLRRSRSRAREAAVAEVIAVLHGLGARTASGGPLSDHAGVAWVRLPDENLPSALTRLRGLGYTAAIDLVSALAEVESRTRLIVARWRRREVALVRVYEESDEELRINAPDRRSFLLECADGVVRPILGYRGGRGPLEHRALAVEDARLLVNLAVAGQGGRLLDPFAGAGGILVEANARGLTTVGVDRDRALRHGLSQLALHAIGDASALPFAKDSFDAVASEPPYDPGAAAIVAGSIRELARVTRPAARIALLVASGQADAVREAGRRVGLRLELDSPIDRKGTSVRGLCWIR